MKIAISAADLDHKRIDGTRIYIQNVLKNFGLLDTEDQFLIYHENEFNPELKFPVFDNYKIIKLKFPFYWTQTRFAWEMRKTKPDILWMPMHSLPLLRSKNTKTIVTIHDLAFKLFPDHFPKKDLRRLNFFTDYAVRNADKLIAVSNSTKNDLLKIYPGLREEKIRVIYHGYDKDLFSRNVSEERMEKIRAKYKLPADKYIIYAGALQPRKNIQALIDAFESLQRDGSVKEKKLVIAGDLGWMYEETMKRIKNNPKIISTGKYETADLPALLWGAEVFVLPSLYEGFGIPVLEAMACGTPVVAADNSSLGEIIGGNGILYKPNNAIELEKSLREILGNNNLQKQLAEKGLKRAEDFLWEKCARETLEWLKS
ncbi:MAG: glycosyltransferase family 1 protein [Parcubacteria group bacterium]|jgi:glycosyltransferase involved in cell wall biosynthesis